MHIYYKSNLFNNTAKISRKYNNAYKIIQKGNSNALIL